MVFSKSQIVNILPLLAYQKIYYDFFSESQWEKHLAYSYNVDYWDGKTQLVLAPEMLQLRYANYPKDYFMGMLPNSQYVSVAVLPPSLDTSKTPDALLLSNSTKSFSYFNNFVGRTAISASASNDSRNLRVGVLNSDRDLS